MPIPGITAAPLLIKPGDSGPSISEIFNTSLWTGNSTARTITTGLDSGEGSLVWGKARTSALGHYLVDTVRGSNNILQSNTSGAQISGPNVITGFNSNGYGIGVDNDLNQSGQSFVGWQFRRSPKFFDIVQYTGNGVSGRAITHNLGIKPGSMIIKRTDAAADWQVYHQSMLATQYGVLNSAAAFATASTRWNNTEPTSSNFTIGSEATVNASGGTYIAYLFAHDTATDGLIQCGSYVGNGSATGPVVNLGWSPQYLMFKSANISNNWYVFDTPRGLGPSGTDGVLFPNTSGSEVSVANFVDTTPTGFQIKNSASDLNSNGETYIYMAIREA